MGSEIDRLYYVLDADKAPYEAKLKQVEADTDATAVRVRASTSKFFSETTEGSARLLAMRKNLQDLGTEAAATGSALSAGMTTGITKAGELERTLAKTSAAGAALATNTKRLWETTAESIERSVGSNRVPKSAAESWQVFGSAIGAIETPAQRLKRVMAEANEEVKRGHGSTAMATREFRALFDEISSGRTRMTPGTLAIIATRVFGISGATLAWGAALLAIPAAATIAAAQVGEELDVMQRKLTATGYAAGVTRDQILGIAHALDETTRMSERGSEGLLGILAGRGNVRSNLLSEAARAASGMAGATGMTLDKAGAELERILADPGKGAKELNDAFKLLSPKVLRHIEDLDASGQKEQAQAIIVAELNGRLSNLKDKGDVLGNTFDNIGKSISDWWHNLGTKTNVALGGGTTQERIDQIKKDLAFEGLNDDIRAERTAELHRLQAELKADQARAATGVARGRQNDAIGGGLMDVDRDDRIATKRRELQNQLNRDELALRTAIATHSDYATAIRAERDATKLALANIKTPAQIAQEEAADAATVAHTPRAHRGQVQAELEARRRRERALADPAQNRYAEDIYNADLVKARYNLHDTNIGERAGARAAKGDKEVLARIEDEGHLADAYRISQRAGEAEEAALEARQAKIRGEISDTDAFVRMKQKEADVRREIAAIAADQRAADELDVLRMEIQLAGVDEDLRAKKIAQLETINRLMEEGWDLSTKGGQAELDRQMALTNANLDLTKTLKDGQRAQQDNLGLMHDGMSVIGGVFDKINQGGAALKQIFPDIEHAVISLIEKLVILNPLENALTGGITGTKGKLPTISMGQIGGSIGSAWSWLSKVIGFGGGGAWSGGVRYAADGMVLGGSTMFNAPGGPVVGGELGKDSEALMPLARGPDGRLGVKAHGGAGGASMHITQQINVHPDVGAVARGEAMKMLPVFKTAAVDAVNEALSRGVPLGGG